MIRLFSVFLVGLISITLSDTIPEQACFDLYSDGEYEKASDCLNSKLISGEITDTLRLHKIYEKLGAAYAMRDRRDLAKAAYKKLLQLDANAEIDPNIYLPEIVSLFLISKFEHRTALRVVVLDTIPAYSTYWNYCPFGIPQFKNGEKTKGWTLLTLQLLSLASSVYAYNREQSYLREGFGFREEDIAIAKRWDVAHRVTFFSCIAFSVYGLVDGFIRKPMVIKQ